MTADPLLSVDVVSAGYGTTEVLQDVSLSVDRGEVVSLVGRNGAGKTTTLRSILGVVEPTAGAVTFADEDVTALSPVETTQRGISLVPEDRRIFPELTVEENLELASVGGADDAFTMSPTDILETFEGLADRRTNAGSALSGGEQQMLAIGRALVAGADLLMLDEPTEGLAPFIVEQVVDLVAELNDHGVTVLLVEQNVPVALELAHRHYIIDQGEVVYTGTSDELAGDDEILDRYLGVTT